MNIIQKAIPLLISLSVIVSCEKKEKGNDVLFPDVTLDGIVRSDTPLTTLFEGYSLIPLETTDESLIGGRSNKVIKNNGHIFVRSMNEIIIFDESGNFKSKLSKVGNGPGEYGEILDFDVVTQYNEIWVSSLKKIVRYKLPSLEHCGNIKLDFYAKKIKYIGNDTFIALTPDDKVFNICTIDGKVLESYLDKDLANNGVTTVQFVRIGNEIVSHLATSNAAVCYDLETKTFSVKNLISPKNDKIETTGIRKQYFNQYGYMDFGKKLIEDYAGIISFRKIDDSELMSVRYPGPECSIIIRDGSESKQYKIYPTDKSMVENDLTDSGDTSFMLSFGDSESDDSFIFMVPNENPDLNPSLLEVKNLKTG